MHEILSRFQDTKAFCLEWPCFIKKKIYCGNILIVTMSFTLKKKLSIK